MAVSGRLTRLRLLLFGLAAPPFQLSQNVIGFHLNLFLLEVAQLRPSLASLVVSTGRVADAVTDPLVGFLVSRTSTRFGRCRPWLLAAGPAGAVAFFCLWLRFNWQYHLLSFVLFSLAITCYHVPYTSLTVRISNFPSDRDAATACRMGWEMLAILVGPMAFAFVVEPARSSAYASANCDNFSDAVGNFSGSVGNFSDSVDSELSLAYMKAAGIVSPLYLLCGLVGFFGTREVAEPDRGESATRQTLGSFFRQFWAILTFKPFLMAMATYLVLTLTWQVFQAIAIQYVTHSLLLGDHVQYVTATYLLVALAAMPVWHKIAGRIGKRLSIMAGTVGTLVCCLLFAICPSSKPVVLYCLSGSAGVCGANAMLLTWAMLPDVIDIWCARGGSRQESVFYSTFTFFNKCANSLAMLLLNLALEASDYKSGACKQSENVGFSLRLLLVCTTPLLLLALLCEWRLPLQQAVADKIDTSADKIDTSADKIDTSADKIDTPADKAKVEAADEVPLNSTIC